MLRCGCFAAESSVSLYLKRWLAPPLFSDPLDAEKALIAIQAFLEKPTITLPRQFDAIKEILTGQDGKGVRVFRKVSRCR